MTRPLVFFDLETTGIDPAKDHIVQASFEKIGLVNALTFTCRPPIPIEEGATEAHGVSNADVLEMPLFAASAVGVQEMVENAILVGYNCRRFDTPILHRELIIAGCRGLDVDAFGEITHPEIDLFLCWKKLEPRTLTGALQRFMVDFGEKWKAHDAYEDTRVLPDLMEQMIAMLSTDQATLEKHSRPSNEVDRDGKFHNGLHGPTFAFGKHKGDHAYEHKDYLRWMLDSNFSDSTKAVCRRVLGHAQ